MIFRREREITVDRAHIRGIRHHDQSHSETFNIRDYVEVFSFPNNPTIRQSDIQGWRSGAVSNVKGKYVSIEFDSERHPD
jgi:hypothetical protein